MDVNSYLIKQYSYPPCFELIADIYVNELNVVLPHYKASDESLKAIANAFRIALHSDHGFTQINAPCDHCVVLMSKTVHQHSHHIGMFYKGKVLHALPTGVVYQDIYSLADQFKQIEYWKWKGFNED